MPLNHRGTEKLKDKPARTLRNNDYSIKHGNVPLMYSLLQTSESSLASTSCVLQMHWLCTLQVPPSGQEWYGTHSSQLSPIHPTSHTHRPGCNEVRQYLQYTQYEGGFQLVLYLGILTSPGAQFKAD